MKELINEAKELIKDINMLQWEVDGALRSQFSLSRDQRETLEKNLDQLNKDAVMINKLIATMENSIEV